MCLLWTLCFISYFFVLWRILLRCISSLELTCVNINRVFCCWERAVIAVRSRLDVQIIYSKLPHCSIKKTLTPLISSKKLIKIMYHVIMVLRLPCDHASHVDRPDRNKQKDYSFSVCKYLVSLNCCKRSIQLNLVFIT